MMQIDDTLRARVRDERERRYRSIRQAAEAGGISNTQWGRFENGEIGLTQPLRVAIARAFDWPDDWPERDAEPVTRRPSPAAVELREALVELAEQVAAQSQQLEAVSLHISALLDAADARERQAVDRMQRVEGRLDQLTLDVRRVAARVLDSETE